MHSSSRNDDDDHIILLDSPPASPPSEPALSDVPAASSIRSLNGTSAPPKGKNLGSFHVLLESNIHTGY
jgi:hypothetical protein